MKKMVLVLMVLFTMGCAAAMVQKGVSAERPATETPVPTRTYLPGVAATVALRNLPHATAEAYDHIPNHAPGTFEVDPNSDDGISAGTGESMDYTTGNNRYAYFEQYVCAANYVDLRGAPMLTSRPIAYVVYGDVVHVHQRWNEWAFINGKYWIELKYLCDF